MGQRVHRRQQSPSRLRGRKAYRIKDGWRCNVQRGSQEGHLGTQAARHRRDPELDGNYGACPNAAKEQSVLPLEHTVRSAATVVAQGAAGRSQRPWLAPPRRREEPARPATPGQDGAPGGAQRRLRASSSTSEAQTQSRQRQFRLEPASQQAWRSAGGMASASRKSKAIVPTNKSHSADAERQGGAESCREAARTDADQRYIAVCGKRGKERCFNTKKENVDTKSL